VTSVIPLMPFNAFFPVLAAQSSQSYVPHPLPSDYEESIESALGLIPIPCEKALNLPRGNLPPQGVCWHTVQTSKPLPGPG
jgi:hypothetical protein